MLNKIYFVLHNMTDYKEFMTSKKLSLSDSVRFPIYVYLDGDNTKIRSDQIKSFEFKEITYEQYKQVTSILSPVNPSKAYFDFNDSKVLLSEIDLENVNEDRYVLVPNDTQQIVSAVLYGLNEIILFKRGGVNVIEVYDFSQHEWVSFENLRLFVEITEILWDGKTTEKYVAEQHKEETKEEPTINSEDIKESKLAEPAKGTYDIILEFMGHRYFYRFGSPTDKRNYLLEIYQNGQWKPEKVSLTQLIDNTDSRQKIVYTSLVAKAAIESYKILKQNPYIGNHKNIEKSILDNIDHVRQFKNMFEEFNNIFKK